MSDHNSDSNSKSSYLRSKPKKSKKAGEPMGRAGEVLYQRGSTAPKMNNAPKTSFAVRKGDR